MLPITHRITMRNTTFSLSLSFFSSSLSLSHSMSLPLSLCPSLSPSRCLLPSSLSLYPSPSLSPLVSLASSWCLPLVIPCHCLRLSVVLSSFLSLFLLRTFSLLLLPVYRSLDMQAQVQQVRSWILRHKWTGERREGGREEGGRVGDRGRERERERCM